jgi:hypothetical protein
MNSDGGARVLSTEDAILHSLHRETAALIADLMGDFLEIDLQGEIVLDGLTGGHVLTYLSREADRMADEILAATGRRVPEPDLDRQWDVRYGGDRPGAVLLDDITESASRLDGAVAGVDDWCGLEAAIRDLPGRRLVQLIVHHADLGRPWTTLPEDDAEIAVTQLPRVMPAELAGIRLVVRASYEPTTSSGFGETVVEGDARSLLAWASGRGSATSGLPVLTPRTWF